MAIPRAARQKKLGWHLYLLASPTEAMTKCLIMAHGGLAGTFANAPLDLHFFSSHGRTLVNPSIPELVTKLSYKGAPASAANCVTSGQTYPDLYLSKLIGRGGEAYTYQEISSYQESPNDNIVWEEPHVILVRHRGRIIGDSIKLSEALRQITQKLPHVTDVYVAACRGLGTSAGIVEFDLVGGEGHHRKVAVGRPPR